MLQSVRVRNFRLFRDLRLEGLGPVNLFTGRNNAGKTTLLEAIFFLGGGGAPLASQVNHFREMRAEGAPDNVFSATWLSFFRSLSPETPIRIDAEHSQRGALSLTIAHQREGSLTVPAPSGLAAPRQGPGSEIRTSESSLAPLRISFRAGSGNGTGAEFLLTPHEMTGPLRAPTIPGVLISGRAGNPQEDARRLGILRKKKEGGRLLEALRRLEPRLKSIEVNSAHGEPAIWGDVGLPELIPLPVMGGGMTRVARVLLAILEVPGGFVLVDEIEDGIHHASFEPVLETLAGTARSLGVQLFLTTHSYECVQKTHAVLGERCMLFRLEDGRGPVIYESEVTEAAIRHNLEVR